MFELNEAVRGRLIGPKYWDRIVGNCFRGFVQSTDCLVILCDELCFKSCIGLYEAENDHEIRVHKVKTICDFLRIVTEGFTIPENSVHKINFVN